MPETNLSLLIIAAAIPAPFAFALALAVRDGREFQAGSLYLILAVGIAATVGCLTGSLVAAVIAGLAPVALLAHARFLGAHRAPAARGTGYARGYRQAPSAGRGAADPDALPEDETPDALQLGMAFIGDVLTTADRIGELRHQRRMRQLARRNAERGLAERLPPMVTVPSPQRLQRVAAHRPPPQLPPPE